jgi:hypothetical protein
LYFVGQLGTEEPKRKTALFDDSAKAGGQRHHAQCQKEDWGMDNIAGYFER